MTSKPKPVVVYLHRYPPETERLQWPALEQLGEILQRDWTPVYLCMGPGNGHRDQSIRRLWHTEELPVGVLQSNGRDKWLKTLYWYAHLGHLEQRIRQLNPAVVICKEMLPFIPGRMVRLGYPTLISISDWWWSILFGKWRWGRRLADAMESREVRSWNRPHVRTLVSTHAEGRLLETKGMNPSRIVVVHPPQNPGVFHPLSPRPAKEELGLDPSLKHFAICGIIRGGKGYDQLLDWWKMAVERHQDWRLVIIGGAGGEAWCRREIAKRSLDREVIMTGWLPTKEDVNRWLNAMDGVLSHRRNSPDNQGLVPSALFNGMSTGRPMIASGLPGMAELVRDGVDGFVYGPDDGESFISAFERVVGDKDAAEAIGMAGARRAADWCNPRTVAEKHHLQMAEMLKIFSKEQRI